MMTFSITGLREVVSQLRLPQGVVGIYVFGSACHKTFPHDLDLLVVYEPTVLRPEQVTTATENLLCGAVQEHAVDLTALTIDEERDSDFIAREGALAVWLRASRLVVPDPLGRCTR
jgi:predicted nucleotidyltransferase